MKTVWFKGMTPEEKEIFAQQVLQSKKVLDKLSEIVYNMLNERQTVSQTDYTAASWPYLQAHNNGACEMARSILEILKVEPKSQ